MVCVRVMCCACVRGLLKRVCLVCDVLCGGVWYVVCAVLCVSVLVVCVCVLFVIYCVIVYGLFLCADCVCVA